MIRKLSEKDYKEVKELVYQVHKLHYLNRADIYTDENPLSLEYFTKIVNDPATIAYVYVNGCKIYGLLIATKKSNRLVPNFRNRTIYFIEDIVVDRNYRRRGIGKSLYCLLKEKAEKEGIDAIELNVWGFNKDAIKFYESLGMSVKNIKYEQLMKNHQN